MPRNKKLAFRSFKRKREVDTNEEEKLIQMEQFLKITSSPKLNIYVFLYFIDLVIKSLFFIFRSLNYHHSNP